MASNDIRQTHNAGEGPLCNRRDFIFTNAGCSFSFHSLDGVEFGRAGGVTVTDDDNLFKQMSTEFIRATAFAIRIVAIAVLIREIRWW